MAFALVKVFNLKMSTAGGLAEFSVRTVLIHEVTVCSSAAFVSVGDHAKSELKYTGGRYSHKNW